jgi:hypothetical protein
MAKRVYQSEQAAEAAKGKAARFAEDILGDPDRAAAIADEPLASWLARTGRRIKNSLPKRNKSNMPKTKQDYLDEIRSLKQERDDLADRLEEAESTLDEISEIATPARDGEDFEDEDDE